MEILIRKTFQGYEFWNYGCGIYKHYIGYPLSQAKKQIRKDFNLKHKKIKFFTIGG